MNSEQLFLEIDGIRLQNIRLLYSPEKIENGIRVGIGKNKYHGNVMTIQYINNIYKITIAKNTSTKYNKITKMFDPPKKIVLEQKEFNNILEVKKFLYELLEKRYERKGI